VLFVKVINELFAILRKGWVIRGEWFGRGWVAMVVITKVAGMNVFTSIDPIRSKMGIYLLKCCNLWSHWGGGGRRRGG